MISYANFPKCNVRIIRSLLQVLLIVVMLLTNIRLLLTQTYLQLEHRYLGVTNDAYGLTADDRLNWASITLKYLIDEVDVEVLANLRFEDGRQIYRRREIRHLQDVKQLIWSVLLIWKASLAAFAILFIILWRMTKMKFVWNVIFDSSKLALYIIAGMLIIGFPTLFLGFHYVFFEGVTWMFWPDDTLVRLFPERFWRDATIVTVVATLIEAVLLEMSGRRYR